MTEQSGTGKAQESQPDAAPSAPSLDDVAVLRETIDTIAAVVTAIRNADQVPSTLEAMEPLEQQETDNRKRDPVMVTRAQNLYNMAVRCLKTVRRIRGYLGALGWTKEQEGIFQQSFDNLANKWSTYELIIRDLSRIGWDDEMPRDRVLAGLERPRRMFIDLIDAYQIQLSVVMGYLDQATDLTAEE